MVSTLSAEPFNTRFTETFEQRIALPVAATASGQQPPARNEASHALSMAALHFQLDHSRSFGVQCEHLGVRQSLVSIKTVVACYSCQHFWKRWASYSVFCCLLWLRLDITQVRCVVLFNVLLKLALVFAPQYRIYHLIFAFFHIQ